MASNMKLIADINAINPDAVTEGLNNAQLSELLKSLKAAILAMEPEPELDPEPTAKKGHYVADGKSITSLRGILGEGREVKAEYFPGGEETFQGLKDRGDIVKK